MRALGLIRVSSEPQATDGYSIPEQRAAITAYCAAQGLKLIDFCEDDGVTGRMRMRLAVRRALELAKAKAFEVLVVLHVDRLGRANYVSQDLLQQFRSLGLRVQFVKHASGDTPADRFQVNILGSVAEYVWEQIRENTMAGRRKKAESGRVPAAFNLFGFHAVRKWEEAADPSQKAGTLRIKPDEAPIILDLFVRYDAGESASKLVQWLNASGIRTRRGNTWTVSGLRLALSNPAYKGEARYGYRSVESYIETNPEGVEKKRFRSRPQSEWITIPCPKIVPLDLWERVQIRLTDVRERVRGQPSNFWPLRGCILCEKCRTPRHGIPLKAVGARKATNPRRKAYLQRFYECRGCNGVLSAKKWETKALLALREAMQPGVLAARALERAKREQETAGDIEGLIERHRREVTALEVEERKLLELAMTFSPKLIEEKVLQLHARKAAAEHALRQALATSGRLEQPEAIIRRAEELSAAVRVELEGVEADPERLQRLFRRFVRITLRKGRAPRLEITAG